MNKSFKIAVLLVTIASVMPTIATKRRICTRCIFKPAATVVPTKVAPQLVAVPNYSEKTPLMQAIEAHNLPLIKQLIASGADVNAVDGLDQPRMGKPVLRYAIDSKSVEIVQLLLQNGADANRHTTSPIMTKRPNANVRNLPLISYAIQQNAFPLIIKLLIQYGADVNQKTVFNEWTPLMVAAYYGNTAAVKLLLEAGANQSDRNDTDGFRYAYTYAEEMGHKEVFDLLFAE